MFDFFRTRFVWKLFFSYLVVLLIGIGVMAIVTNLATPATYQRHLLSSNTANAAEPGLGQGWMGGKATAPGGMAMQLFQRYRDSVNEAFIYASLAAFAAALVISALISTWVVKPIKAMTTASQRIAQGHYNERVLTGVRGPGTGDELRQLAESFNQMAEQLEQTETLRRSLLADVTHELRTPLTTIKGSMEALLDGVIEAEPEVFARIHTESSRLQRLVDDLQELSRLESGTLHMEPRAISLREHIRSAADLLQPQYEFKGVQLQVVDGKDLTVMAEPDRLRQVLMNLLGNALQYTPQGGHVRVAASTDGGKAILTVSDTGIGIPPEHIEHIFTRFYRVEKSRARSRGGSGIGLTVTRTLVEAMGGEIKAESPGEGQGSTFRVTLPLA